MRNCALDKLHFLTLVAMRNSNYLSINTWIPHFLQSANPHFKRGFLRFFDYPQITSERALNYQWNRKRFLHMDYFEITPTSNRFSVTNYDFRHSYLICTTNYIARFDMQWNIHRWCTLKFWSNDSIRIENSWNAYKTGFQTIRKSTIFNLEIQLARLSWILLSF